MHLIVVDDNSTDNTVEIVLKYQSMYPGLITLISNQKNRGTGAARDLALQQVKTQYVGFVDCDDWIDTDMYLRLVEAIKEDHAEIAVCGVMREYEEAGASEIRYCYPSRNLLSGKFALSLLSKRVKQDIGLSSIVCNKIFDYEFLQQNDISFHNLTSCEDDYFTFLCLSYASKVSIVPGIYYHYYQHGNSQAHLISKEKLDALIHSFELIRDRLGRSKQFDSYQKDYYCFLAKCLSFLIEMLFLKEQDASVRKSYISYFIKKSSHSLDLFEFLDNLGPNRIRKLFEC